MPTQQKTQRAEVLAEVVTIVAEYVEIDPQRITEASLLQADLGCDSLDLVEISMEVEERFAIEVPEDLAGDRPVVEIVDFVLSKLNRT